MLARGDMSFLGHFNCLSDRHPAAACSFHGILTMIACVPYAFSLCLERKKKKRLKEKKKITTSVQLHDNIT